MVAKALLTEITPHLGTRTKLKLSSDNVSHKKSKRTGLFGRRLLPCICGPGKMFERIVLTLFTKNERNLIQSLREKVVASETEVDTILLIVPNKIFGFLFEEAIRLLKYAFLVSLTRAKVMRTSIGQLWKTFSHG